MVRVVHFSDWHESSMRLPEADLYVCTGDMYDNYPVMPRGPDGKYDPFGNWSVAPAKERREQALEASNRHGWFRELAGSPDAPVVCVRGNHDFIDLAPLFEGCNLVHEFRDNELVEVLGLRVSGHQGIPSIYGTWNDEVFRADLLERVRGLPENLNLLLTHYPPAGILDFRYGLDGMANALQFGGKMGTPFVHCFGHVHECGGRKFEEEGVTFSNAACSFNEIEIEVK